MMFEKETGSVHTTVNTASSKGATCDCMQGDWSKYSQKLQQIASEKQINLSCFTGATVISNM